VRARALLDQCCDEVLEELLRLRLVEPQEVAERIHHRVDSTQPVQVPLLERSLVPGHQTTPAAGEPARDSAERDDAAGEAQLCRGAADVRCQKAEREESRPFRAEAERREPDRRN
jgi:hypothetical protein